MGDLIKIESCPDYVKDTTSGAILNTNNAGLAAYKRQKKLMRSVNTDHERLNSLEDQMNRIESLLLKLVGNQ